MVNLLIRSISRDLNSRTCMIIYDQLKKLNIEPKFNDKIKKMISLNSYMAFKSSSFVEIDENTLIDVLNFKKLNIYEHDILKECARWINHKCSPNETLQNKNERFKKIKNFIRFSDLTIENLKNCNNLNHLLTLEEIGSLFLHLVDKSNPFLINCQTKREPIEILNVSSIKNFRCIFSVRDRMEITGNLTVNLNVSIFTIQTYFKAEVTNLSFFKLHCPLSEVEILCEKKLYDNIEPKWSFIFNNIFELEPNRTFKFSIKFNLPFTNQNYMLWASNDLNLRFVKNDIPFDFIFTFQNFKCNCIKSIEFGTI